MRLIGILLILCVAPGIGASPVSAEWREFAPRPFENGAFVDGYGSYERDHNDTGRSSSEWTDKFFRERFTLYSNGYSYHPRFLQYAVSLSGLLSQEEFDASFARSHGWQSNTGWEYDGNLYLLPDHPYNLHLFARRYEPLFKEQAATQHSTVENSRGASFRYRRKPYFFNARYTDESIESAQSNSDATRLFVDGQYFKNYANGNELAFTAAYNASWFSASDELDGNSAEYLLGNFVNLKRVRFSTNVSKTEYEQHSPLSGKFSSDHRSGYELVNAYLPWRFRADASYRYDDNDTTIEEPGDGEHQKLSDTSKTAELDVYHRLYESLDSRYTLLDSSLESSGGDTTTLSHAVTLNYAKTIPRGRINAGINLGRSDTDSHGRTDVANEPHDNVSVPGAFSLQQQNVDEASIVVFLKSPLPPQELIQLVESVDYLVVPLLNSFEIRVFALPPQFVVPGTYNFVTSYSLTVGDYELRSDMYGGNINVELFENLLTPYFSYQAVRPHVVSGTFPGTPLDATTYITGLLCERGPWRVRGEYQDLQWDVSPYRAWRVEVQYVKALNDTTSIFSAASYLNKHYPHGLSETEPTAFTEETVTATGSIQKQFFSRNLYLSGGGSYSRLNGLTDTNAYSVHGTLVWKIGKVEVIIGASAYMADTTGSGVGSTKRDHQLSYLKLRRQLF